MNGFQIILVIALIFILISYFRRFRRPAIHKLFITVMLLSGIVFVLRPETTNKLAHLLGIGRGADLIFYLAIVTFTYLLLILYAKIKDLEYQLTTLIRKQTLDALKTKNEPEQS